MRQVGRVTQARSNNATKADPVPDSAPPISVSRFLEVSGLSPVSAWRFEKRGWLKVVRIAGRKYLLQRDLIEFNRRLEAGEFAGKTPQPRGKRKVDQ